MKNKNLLINLNRTAKMVQLKLKKNSPEILIGAGVVGVIASAVMACKATIEANEVVKETKVELEKVKDQNSLYKVDEKEATKKVMIVYGKNGLKLVKLYAPSIALGTLSLSSILLSHKILRTRNIAIAAAYKAVDSSFKDYRKKVIEKFGDAIDKELKYDLKNKEVEIVTVDENGKEVKTKENVQVSEYDPNKYSEFAKFFDVGNPNWQKDSEYNLYFLRQQEAFANDKLQKDGYLFLNDVYDMLGIPKTRAGQLVGWIYDKENPIGDNYVSFGIYDYNKPGNRDFVNGIERTILLDFNVDGNILELM